MDTDEIETPVIPKPKKAKKPRKVAKPKPEAAKVAFPGLTETECAAGCTAAKCAISGANVCGHPRKGGLQAGDNAALKRLQDAQKQLGLGMVERRYA